MRKFLSILISAIVLFAVSATAADRVTVIPLNSSQKIAKSGQTFAGNVSVYNDAGNNWEYASLSFPFPLPAGTAEPTLQCLATTSGSCPGIGQASPGYLCIYRTNEINASSCNEVAGSNGKNRLYGYTFGISFPSNLDGWLIGSWAYTVP